MRYTCLAGIVVAVLMLSSAGFSAASPVTGKTKNIEQTFRTTFDAFQKLSGDQGGTREQWERIIHSFADIHKSTKSGPTGNRSLFLAGRACLALYRRSGAEQDLDEAIRYLNGFLRHNRSGPYRMLGLQELKEAHLLKRKACTNRTAAPPKNLRNSGLVVDVSRNKSQFSKQSDTPNAMRGTFKRTVRGQPQVAEVQPKQTVPAGISTDSFGASLSSSSPMYNCTGNPFFDKRTPAVSQNVDPNQKRVFSPFSVITDLPRSRPMQPAETPSMPQVGPEPESDKKIPDAPPAASGIANIPPIAPLLNDVRNAPSPTLPTEGSKETKDSERTQSNYPSTPLPLKGPVIVIDPGHGGKDPGAVSQDGTLKEKTVTLHIAAAVKRILEDRIPNAVVTLTRDDDSFLQLQERTALANSLNADLFISVHCNGADDASSRGIETYYLSKASSARAMASAARENGISPNKMTDIDVTLLDLVIAAKKTESVQLAESVHNSLLQALSGLAPAKEDRGVKRAPFYVLLGAKMPAILIECGFINGKERESLKKPAYLNTIGMGIAEGTIRYLQGLGHKIGHEAH